MSTKINFTKEHQDRLNVLASDALVKGTKFKGNLGSEMTIYDLFHNCTVTTLSRYHTTIKKEVGDIEALDEWSLTPYQQQKAANLKKNQELINLLIGYKRNLEQKEAAATKLASMKDEYAKLKESTKTPEDKLKELEQAMATAEAELV